MPSPYGWRFTAGMVAFGAVLLALFGYGLWYIGSGLEATLIGSVK
jgi:hypothetical protein